jgi:hypothetical protein
MDVHLLQHIRHARNLDGSPIEHRDADGELNFDERHDDFKIVGVYSSAEAAREGMSRARKLAGFREEPECFIVDTYTLDDDCWTDGFVSIPFDGDDEEVPGSVL